MATELVRHAHLSPAVRQAVAAWADATTRPTSKRRADLLRDKGNAVEDFFSYTGKHPTEATALDVKSWQAALEARGLAPATVYATISRLSSFYAWLARDSDLAGAISHNPVSLARPKAPKAYQNESAQSLTDDDLLALLAVVRGKAEAGELVGLRDHALLLFYVYTGWRRAEVIGLRRGDVRVNGGLLVTLRVKGGDIVTRTVDSRAVRDALLAYVRASGREWATMEPGDPIWTRHDRAGQPGPALTSHAFAKNFKRYARQAGLGDVHLHQTRHTLARIVGEETGSIKTVQEILGHSSEATTRIYLKSVGVQPDQASQHVARRLGL